MVLYMSGNIPFEDCLALASKLDSAITNAAPEIMLTDSLVMPDVRPELPLPAISPGQVVDLPLHVKNVAPSAALLGSENLNVVLVPGERPILRYYAPDKAAQDTVVLIISTPGNLVAKSSFVVEVK